MANTVKLGARPKTFKTIDVPVTLPDGTDGVIPVTYKYRTKSEYGKWVDEAVAAATAKSEEVAAQPEKKGKAAEAPLAEPAVFSWETFYRANTEASADQLLDAIDSWGLSVPLTKAALIQLGDEIPAAIIGLLSTYGGACREGRLGN